MAYLKSCSEWFKHDEKLLRLFTECDWKQVSMKAIPKMIAEEEFDSMEKDELRLSSYRDQMPPAQPLFNLYTEQTSDDESESVIAKPEFIQNESDIPNTFCTDSSDEVEFAVKGERSLEEFLKRQGVQDDKRVLDSIPLLKESARIDPTPSPFVYIQLEYGDDSILTKSGVMKVLKTAGVEDVKSVYIMNKMLAIADEEPDLESSLLDARLKGNPDGVDEEKLVELSQATRQSPLSKDALQDEQLTGLSTQSSEMEKDKQRIKEVFKFAASVPRRNQTHGFIEFRKVESKAQLLKTNYRLFGMEINGGLMVTEDADFKRTLRVGNLPWSTSPVHLVNFLNKVVSSSGETMQFSCPDAYQNCVSDASYLYLQFGSFLSAFKMCRFLNTEMYRGRPLQVDFKHGCAKYVQGRYVEHYHTAMTLENERLHINHRTFKKQQAVEEALVNN